MTSAPAVELHPWNRDFEWTPHHAPLRRLTPAEGEQFDRDGFVVLENVFTDAEIDPVVEVIDRLEAKTDEFLSQMENGRMMIAEQGAITFTLFPVNTEPVARAFAAHRVFADLCHDLVGPNARLYHDQAVYKKPQKPRRFPWHQDNGYTFVEPQQYLTCWVALNDATVDNGCPHVARKLHRGGTLAHTYQDPLGWEIFEDYPDTVTAPVGKGGIVVFSSLSPHLTGPNTTDAVRKSYILQYAPHGAEVLHGDAAVGVATARSLADDATRQFPILVDDEWVPPPSLPSN